MKSRTSANASPDPTAGPHELAEAEYLDRQAADAKAAMGGALADLFSSLGKGVGRSIDPRPLARRRPIVALSAALAAGFITTTVLVPSREQRLARRLAKLHRAMQEPLEDDEDGGSRRKRRKEKGGSRGKRGIVGALLAEAITAMRPLISSAISAAVNSRMNAGANADDVDPDAPQDDPMANSGPAPMDQPSA